MMRALPSALLASCLSACLAPLPSEARPVSAVLYPGMARVTEEAVLTPKDGRIALLLPSRADAESLSVTLSSGREAGRTLSLRSGGKPAAVEALLREKEAQLAEQDRLAAELAVMEGLRRAACPGRCAPGDSLPRCAGESCAKPSGDARRLKAAIAEEVRLRSELRRVGERLSRIEADIRELGGQDSLRECVLDVAGADDSPQAVRWSYWLNEAGWRPQYRVEADTSQGRISIRMDAAITQKSGEDWDDVDVALSSADAMYSVAPPSLHDWLIGGERGTAPRNVMLTAAPRAMKGAAASLEVSAVQEASSLTWKLGRIDVPASSTALRLVGEHAMDATFRRLVRPSLSRQAWIEGGLASPAALALPSGQATFTVDGAETARGAFSLVPGASRIAFGVDRLISVEASSLPAPPSAPAEGMKSLHWGQSVTIASGHGRPVAVRVEEAAPLAKDSRISVDVQASPAPVLEQGGTRYAWTLELPARERISLRWSVAAAAPEGVPVSSSR